MQKKRMIVYLAFLIIGIVISSTLLMGMSNTSTITDNSDINVPRSATPDSCVYPATYDIEYNTSFLFRGNYASQINVSKETAVDAATTFLNVYLPEELLTGLRIGGPEDGWPGPPSFSTDFLPEWRMTLVSDYIRTAVFVNALSGKVVYFTMSRYETADFNFEPINSTEEAENHTIDFLRLQNYTLLPDAVYGGVALYSAQSHPYYMLTFHQVVDEIPVSFGEIYFEIDATYGLINHFVYRWIEISEIPVDRVLPVEEINVIALEAANGTFLSEILSTDLCFNRFWFGPDSPEFEMRLVYEVRVARGVNPDVYTIDAISGEVLGMGHEIGVIFTPYVGVAAMLMVAIVSSGAAYKFVKKKQLYSSIE